MSLLSAPESPTSQGRYWSVLVPTVCEALATAVTQSRPTVDAVTTAAASRAPEDAACDAVKTAHEAHGAKLVVDAQTAENGKSAEGHAVDTTSSDDVNSAAEAAVSSPRSVVAEAADENEAFDSAAFHRSLSSVLKTLRCDTNVGKAVGEVRRIRVPVEHQADEFSNILSRAAEEWRGTERRVIFAFAIGLAKSDTFELVECLIGTSVWFDDVYASRISEDLQLKIVVVNELLPMLSSVFPAKELRGILPAELRTFATNPAACISKANMDRSVDLSLNLHTTPAQ